MTTTPIDYSWIKAGAQVVLYRESHRGDSFPRLTTVQRVATKSFTVSGIDVRIKLNTLASADLGDRWTRWNYAVVKPDSKKARELFAAEELGRLHSQARNAVLGWQGHSTIEKLDAAIAALQTLRSALGIQEGDGDGR